VPTPPASGTEDGRRRCGWATGPWLLPYHDDEWGVEVHDDRVHFEHLTLEAAQAGLSWLTVLKRRDGYRRAFAGFDPAAVAAYGPDRIDALAADAGIIRNRRKIEATVANASSFLAVQEEFGSFDAYLWSYVDGEPKVNRWRSTAEVPASTPLSESVSRDLRRRGFSFVGPTVCYSHLQAAGLVVDHVVTCFRHPDAAGA
jgi:DNA-3-methyladenine glycosylase I